MANIALITNNILSDSGTALTSVLSGSGTTNYLSKFTGSTALGNSIIYDNGTAVGIGTTTPGAPLSFADTNVLKIQLNGNSANYYGIAKLAGGGNLQDGNFQFVAGNTYAGGFTFISEGVEKVRFTYDGNVGIGTTSPNGNLDINSPGSTQLIVRDPGSILRIVNAGGANWIQSANAFSGSSTADLYFSGMYGSPIHMILKATGNLLIGTTTDSGAKLQVNGTGRFSGGIVSERTIDALSGLFLRSNIDGSSILNNGIILGKSTSTNDAASIVYTHVSNGSSSNRLGLGFWNADNLLNLTASGNVGIGTTSPQTKLQVFGTVGYGSIRIAPSSTNGESAIGFFLDTAGTATSSSWIVGQGGWGNTGKFVIGNENSGAGGNVRFTIEKTGEVGIGTTTPLGKLDVVGTSGTVRIETGGDAIAFTKNGANYISAKGGAGSFLVFETGGAVESMRITSANNVLIGTTTDAGDKLHVVGSSAVAKFNATSGSGGYLTLQKQGADIFYWGASTAISGQGTNTDLWSTSAYGISLYSNGNPSYNLTLTSGGNVGIGNTAPNEKLELSVGNGVTGGIRINYSAAATGEGMDITYLNNGNTTTSFDSRYNSDSAVMRFRMKTAGTAVNAITILGSGNVGIGTSSPGYKLQVSGESMAILNPNSPASLSGADATLYLGGAAVPAYIKAMPCDWYAQNYRLEIGTQASTTAQKTYITFATEGAERMRIASTGNVLIGTTTDAGYKLDVNGTARVSGNATNGAPFFSLNATSANNTFNWVSTAFASNLASGNNLIHFIGQSGSTKNAAYLGFKYSGSGSNDNILTLGLYGVDNVLNINGLGYVGIGTSTPSDKLHISGNLRVTGTIIDSNNSPGTSGQVLSSTATGTDWVSLSEITGVDGTGTTNYVSKWLDANTIGNSLVYDDGTNIGIGTTNPTGQMAGTTGLGIFHASYPALGLRNASYQWLNYLDGSYYKFWNAGAGDVMSITYGGNVLIGTSTDPGYKLYVNGATLLSSGTTGNSVVIEGPSGRYLQFGTDGSGQYIEQTGTSSATRVLRIQNSNGSGTYTQLFLNGANQTIYTSSNVNVGIGTSSPSAKLSVIGQGTGIALIGDPGFGSNNYTAISLNGSLTTGNYNILSSPTDSTLYINRPSGVAIRFREANGTDQMIIQSGGNVGIGTTSVGVKFVNSGGGNSSAPTLGSGTVGSQALLSANGLYGMYSGVSNSGDVWHQVQRNDGNTTVYNLLFQPSGGNVGIGTTSPLVALDVRGTVIITNQAGGNYNENLRLPESTSGYASLTLGGSIAASGTSAAQWTLVKFPTTNNFSIRNNNSDYVTVFPTGNFAIGTTTDAGYKLDVVNGAVRIVYSAFAGIEYHNTAGTWEGYIGTENGAGNLRYNSRQGAHTWYANSAANMKLTATGNLGIGTTSPTEKLDIVGNVRIRSNSGIYYDTTGATTSNYIGITNDYWTTLTCGRGYSSSINLTNGNGILFNANYTEAMRIEVSNNVLIGTTTDAGQKLQVNGSGNFNLGNSGYIKLQSGSGQRHGFVQSAYSNFLFSNNVYYDGSNWRYDQNGYGAQIQTETLSVGVIAFNTFASGTGGSVATIIESMRIVNNGNILMGTTSDSGHKLQVNGTSKFTNSIYLTGTNRFIASGSSSQSLALYGGSAYTDGAYFNITGNTYGASPGGGSAEFVIRTNSDSKFAMFGYNGSSWLRYMTLFGPTGNMNIGYGTSDNGYKFTVQGDAYVEGNFRADGAGYFQNAIIQNYFGFNYNAIGGITSYQSSYNLYTFGNGNYSGDTIDGVLATSISAGQIVFLTTSAQLWDLATGSSVGAAATNIVGIACANGNYGDTVPILLNGFFASNSWYSTSSQYGMPMYLSTAVGQATTTAPSSTGNVVRILGHVMEYGNANGCAVMRFNPDNSWLVI